MQQQAAIMAAAGGYINPMAIAAQLPAQVQMPNGLTSPAAMTPTSGSYRRDRHPPTCLPDMPLYAFLLRLFRLFCSIPSYFVLFRLSPFYFVYYLSPAPLSALCASCAECFPHSSCVPVMSNIFIELFLCTCGWMNVMLLVSRAVLIFSSALTTDSLCLPALALTTVCPICVRVPSACPRTTAINHSSTGCLDLRQDTLTRQYDETGRANWAAPELELKSCSSSERRQL